MKIDAQDVVASLTENKKHNASLSRRLNAVIKSIESSQEYGYSATNNLILSYLYDIRDNNVPKETLKRFTPLQDSGSVKHD